MIYSALKRIILTCAIFPFCNHLLMSQHVNLDSLLEVAKKDYKKGDFDTVHAKSNLILDLAKGRGDWKNYYEGALRLIKIFQREERWIEGLDSIASWQSTVPSDQHLVIGNFLFYKGKFQAALNLNYFAIPSYQLAATHFSKAGDKKRLAYSYQILAIQHARIHDYKLSRAYAKKALENLPDIPKLTFKKDELNELIAQTYNWEENPEKAIEFLVNYQNKVGIYNEAQSLLASFYMHSGEFNKADQLLNSLQDLSLFSKIDVFETKRLIAENRGDIEKAIDYQKELCKLMPQKYGKREYLRERVLLAQLYYDNNQSEEANLIVDGILAFSEIDINQSTLLTESNLDRVELFTAKALYLKCRILFDSDSKQKNIRETEKALRCVESSLKIIDRKKQFVTNNQEKLRLSEIQRDYSQWVISFLNKKWNKAASEEVFEKAFLLSQMTNAGILKESIESNTALDHCSLPEHLRYQWMSTKIALANMKSDLVTELHETYDSLHSLVREMCPTYDHLMHDQVVTISDIRAKLDDHVRLIKYHRIDDTYHVFTISSDTLIWDVIPESGTIDSLVNQLFEILSLYKKDSISEKNFIKSSNTLYERLIASYLLESKISDTPGLIIVPDGILGKLPFDALLMRKSSSWIDPKAYLINEYDISYLYYCAQLMSEFTRNSENTDFAGFGANYSKHYFSQLSNDTINFFEQNPEESNRLTLLEPLHNGKKEVTEICEMLEGVCYLEDELTFENIVSELKNKSMVHFSIHTYVLPNKIMESGLLIYPQSNSGLRNKLSYADILNIRLNNDLIVLSSCQSSYGRLNESEGVISLARAFIQSGSKCVVGNLWNISDNNTPKLMTVFYENIEAGYTSSESMRLAKIDYLNNDETSTPSIRLPHFWAGWKVYGIANSKMHDKNPLNKSILLFWAVGILGLILLLSLVLPKDKTFAFRKHFSKRRYIH